MLGDSENLRDMQKGIKNAFKAVKQELNMHLDTINQIDSDSQLRDEKTEERFAEMREYINERFNELNTKLEKINEKFEEQQICETPNAEESFGAVELTNREQEVFLVIYSENEVTSAKDIGKRLGFTDEMVNRYIYNMISKGIPLLRQYKNGETYVSMDLKFKDLQTRKNILKIDESISKQLLSDKAI